MVSATVAIAVTAIGIVLSVAGIGLGAMFMMNDSFAIAQRACNPEVITNPDAQADAEEDCADFRVVGADGETCQIANLGLYSASFTPECTYGTEYQINPLLSPQKDVDPLEITPLFPAQTSLGSVGTALGVLGFEEFSNCEEFFAATSPVMTSYGTAAASGAILGTYQDAAVGIKDTFDESLRTAVGELGAVFTGARLVEIGAFNQILAASAGFSEVNFTYTEITGAESMSDPLIEGGVDFIDDLLATANALSTASPVLSASFAGFYGVFFTLDSSLPTSTDGTTLDAFTAAAAFPNYLPEFTGLPFSPWSAIDNPILCATLGGACDAVQFMSVVAAALASVDPSDPQIAQITLAVGLFDNYASNNGGAVDLRTAALNESDTSVSFDSVVEVILLTLFDSDVALVLTDNSSPLGAKSPIPDTLNATLGLPYGIVCQLGGQPVNCIAEQYFQALSDFALASGDTDTQGDLLLLAGIASDCTDVGVNSLALCTQGVQLMPGQAFWAASLYSVLSNFYSIDDFNNTATDVQSVEFREELISQCNDGNANAEGLALNQTTVPAGVALLSIGAVIMLINLLVRPGAAKVIGVIGAVIALIGAVVALAGFLILQGTPIYSSVTEPEPEVKPDAANAFSTSEGLLLALGFIGAGLIGSLFLLVGGCLLTPKGDTSTEILGKA